MNFIEWVINISNFTSAFDATDLISNTGDDKIFFYVSVYKSKGKTLPDFDVLKSAA